MLAPYPSSPLKFYMNYMKFLLHIINRMISSSANVAYNCQTTKTSSSKTGHWVKTKLCHAKGKLWMFSSKPSKIYPSNYGHPKDMHSEDSCINDYYSISSIIEKNCLCWIFHQIEITTSNWSSPVCLFYRQIKKGQKSFIQFHLNGRAYTYTKLPTFQTNLHFSYSSNLCSKA